MKTFDLTTLRLSMGNYEVIGKAGGDNAIESELSNSVIYEALPPIGTSLEDCT